MNQDNIFTDIVIEEESFLLSWNNALFSWKLWYNDYESIASRDGSKMICYLDQPLFGSKAVAICVIMYGHSILFTGAKNNRRRENASLQIC